MFIIRTAFWLGIVVLVMPSDPAQQKQISDAARNGIAQASTLCDRHATVCRHASVAWTGFKAKAETAGRMVFNLAMERMAAPAARPAAVGPAAAAPAATTGPATNRQHGTLRDDDQAPRWRGDQAQKSWGRS
jgi:hypothetical protein